LYAGHKRTQFPDFQEAEQVSFLEARPINKKITIIGMQGLSFDFIIPLANKDKLKNFSWLMEEGSWGRLKTFSPNETLLLNCSFNTGKKPAKHRQISKIKYQFLDFRHQVEIVPRFVFFRQLTRTGLLLVYPNQTKAYTTDIWKIFKDNKTLFLKKEWPQKVESGKISPKAETLFNHFFKGLKEETLPIIQNLTSAFFKDLHQEEQVLQEKSEKDPQIIYFMLNGLNTVESYFYRYHFPDLFGNIDQEKIDKFSSIIEKYYQFYDQIIGKHLTTLKENELLIVFSPHGIEPLPVWRRFVEQILGNTGISAYHELAPDGVVFFIGQEIARGKNIEGIELIDIVPTLLYYLGFHVGKDMDGIARTSIFVDKFRAENPVSYISSYDEITIR
jgi:predicted AlkP superfamily pyrophosphatase or phosphodiesterase